LFDLVAQGSSKTEAD